MQKTNTLYKCYKCNNYETNRFNDMKKHMCKKYICKTREEIKTFSNDYILLMSLIPYYNDNHSIDVNDICHLSNTSMIYENKDELFGIILDIEKYKSKKCKFCNREFDLIYDLKKHTLINCFFDELNSRQILLSEINNITPNLRKIGQFMKKSIYILLNVY